MGSPFWKLWTKSHKNTQETKQVLQQCVICGTLSFRGDCVFILELHEKRSHTVWSMNLVCEYSTREQRHSSVDQALVQYSFYRRALE